METSGWGRDDPRAAAIAAFVPRGAGALTAVRVRPGPVGNPTGVGSSSEAGAGFVAGLGPADGQAVASSTDVLRAAQVRAASTAFLRLRPLVVLGGMIAQGALLAQADVPAEQRRFVAGILGTALALFTAESIALRRRQVSEPWLVVSLAATMIGLAIGASATGGHGSPLATLLLAPLVVALAALGRRALPLVLTFSGLVITLALAPPLGAPLPEPIAAHVRLVSLLVTAVLLGLGVLGLVDAHAKVAGALEAMQRGAIEEAQHRAREAEALGARVAHELKNPLAATTALVTLAARSATLPKERERLDVALGELGRMERSIDDYLTLARPLTDVALERVALGPLLDAIADTLGGRAELAGVRLAVRPTELRASADPRRLREALVNLALNAIEAMPRGGTVELGASVRDGRVALTVTDDGPGMPPEVRAKAGEAFFTLKERGTGLGLRLSRSVARMHGGDLTFEHPARGLRAVLTLGAEA